MNNKIIWSIRAWLIVDVLATALTAWEIYGVEPGTPWHTISYWSYQHHSLGWLILGFFGGLFLWWWHHFLQRHGK